MRVCSSCGRENPDDRDFCECGEYLRWDPTGVVQAVTPEVLAGCPGAGAARRPPSRPPRRSSRPPAAAARAAAAARSSRRPGSPRRPRRRRPAAPPTAPASRRARAAAAAGRAAARGRPAAGARSRRAAARDARAAPSRRRRPPRRRSPRSPTPRRSRCACRRATQGQPGETLRWASSPAAATACWRSCATRAAIVDNYELSVRGLPDDWWSIFPNTVYLVPFGTSGTYEQEVEIHLHPPRTPEAEARIWELQVVGRVEGLQPAGRRRAAEARHPAVRGVQDQARARARVRPQEGELRRRGQEHGQRAG